MATVCNDLEIHHMYYCFYLKAGVHIAFKVSIYQVAKATLIKKKEFPFYLFIEAHKT